MTEQMSVDEMNVAQEAAEVLADRMLEVVDNSTFGGIVLASICIIVLGLPHGDTISDREQALQSTIKIMRGRFEAMELERVQA